MRSTKIFLLLPALAALALPGCKKEGVEGPLAGCQTASYLSYCSQDSDCCSFGCVYGVCQPNPLEGGVCRTNADCASPRFCMNGKCETVTCVPSGACGAIPCCSGICSVGACAPDHAPVAVAGPKPGQPVPFRIPLQLTNGSYDVDNIPQTSGITYAWRVVSAPTGSLAKFLPTATYATPQFTPDVASPTVPYVLELKASSGAASSTDTITLYAIDTLPEIGMPPDILGTSYQSRNVPLQFSASVADADGGPITCTWEKKGPTAGSYTLVSGPETCAGASGVRATGTTQYTLNEDEGGTWEIRLTVTDGSIASGSPPSVSKSRFIAVLNDPPVAEAGAKRWGNYSLGTIPISGIATDINLDVVNLTSGVRGFTWSWDVTSAPTGSALGGTNVGTTPSIAFAPDHEGLYTLTLTVDDHQPSSVSPHGTTGTDTVEVQVEPYILPLGEVADARYVTGSQKIVVAQTDVGNAYQLMIVNPETLALDPAVIVTLAAKPTRIGLNATQTEAIVAEVGGGWQRIAGIQTTPSVAATVPAGQGATSDLTEVVFASDACAYGMTGGGTVYKLAASAPYADATLSTLCANCANTPLGNRGAAGEPATNNWVVWTFQTTSGRLGRYTVNTSNCKMSDSALQTYSSVAGKNGFWLSADVQDLFTAWTTVYASDTLATRSTSTLPSVPDHLSTTQSGGQLVCAIAQTASPSLLTASRTSPRSTGSEAFTAGGSKPYPYLGYQGNQIWNYGQYAFVKSGGGAYYAVVRANVGTAAAPVYRWGMVNLGP